MDDKPPEITSMSIQFGTRPGQVLIKLEKTTQVIGLSPHQARYWAKMLKQLANKAEMRPNPVPAVFKCQHSYPGGRLCRQAARWQDKSGHMMCDEHSDTTNRKPLEQQP